MIDHIDHIVLTTRLGGMIVKYGNLFETAKMFVPIVVVSLLGLGARAPQAH